MVSIVGCDPAGLGSIPKGHPMKSTSFSGEEYEAIESYGCHHYYFATGVKR